MASCRRGWKQFGLEVVDLCHVPDVDLPADFRTPEFDKYKGSSCPGFTWLSYVYDDEILIHCFQDSLTGAALN
ncbi:hypothetical protein CR513_05444, partial [Mucuna pruriens]